jgi:hypothetical protein
MTSANITSSFNGDSGSDSRYFYCAKARIEYVMNQDKIIKEQNIENEEVIEGQTSIFDFI